MNTKRRRQLNKKDGKDSNQSNSNNCQHNSTQNNESFTDSNGVRTHILRTVCKSCGTQVGFSTWTEKL